MEVQVVSFWETENGSGWRIRETGKRVSCKLKRNGMHGGQVGSFGKRETASGKQVSRKLLGNGMHGGSGWRLRGNGSVGWTPALSVVGLF